MDFFQPATDATCSLPPRKPATVVGGTKAHKTRRARKVTATRRRHRRNMAGGAKKHRQVTRRRAARRVGPKRKRANRKTLQRNRK